MTEQVAGMKRAASLPSKSSPASPGGLRAHYRGRMKAAVAKYPGITDTDAFIKERMNRGIEARKEREQQYWDWQKDVKKKAEVSFNRDDLMKNHDPEKQVQDNVDKAVAKTKELDAAYQLWLEEIKVKHEERMRQQVKDKLVADGEFAGEQEKAKAKFAEQRQQAKTKSREVANGYWAWLETTKGKIAARPCSAPPPKASEVESVDSMVKRRRAEMTKKDKAMKADYGAWLESVKKPKFTLPPLAGNTVADRNALIDAAAKKGVEGLSAKTNEYKQWVAEMKDKHHQRMVENVKIKLNADKEFDKAAAGRAAALDEQMEEAKRKRDEVAAQSAQFLAEMAKRVQKKPLLVEDAYALPGHARHIPSKFRGGASQSAPTLT